MAKYTQLKLKPEYREKLERIRKATSRSSLANAAEVLIDQAIAILDARGGK
jgi:hypothetical protein